MSVRRLADEEVQPKSFAFTKANQAWAKQTIGKYPEGREASAVIPLLMRAQEQEGWVSRPAVEHVAGMLDMPLIRVLEVATFYTQFMLKPVGTKAHVQVCGTTPCMLRGAEKLTELCRHRIAHEPLETNEAGTLSWEEVECQGACVNAPMVMIGSDTYEDLTPERLEEILDAFEAGKGDGVTPGPQVERVYSAPQAGLTSLTDEKAVTRGANGKGAKEAGGRQAKETPPPSNAAVPKTDASVTNKAIKSPSKTKTGPETEKKASAKTSPTMKLASTASSFKQKAPAKGYGTGRKPNPTMKLAGTASGAPKPADAKQPAGMERPAKVDDLQLISGVGPKIEGMLHDLGIYTYKQVAGWKKAERAWVDDHLSFHGRIDREDWVKQAKALAKGGAAEYEKVFGKKPR